MVVEFVLDHPVWSLMIMLFVLELYLRKSGTKYDTQVRMVKDVLLSVFEMVRNRNKSDGDSSEDKE